MSRQWGLDGIGCPSNVERASKSPYDLISEARGKGATIWLENDLLHYRSPKGALTKECVEQLRKSRDSVLALLRVSSDNYDNGGRIISRAGVYRAPLAFSQVAHWNLYGLADKPSACVIPALTRIHGAVDTDTLLRCVATIVRRHGALRTRIVLSGGVPLQEVDCFGTLPVRREDWTDLPEDVRESALHRAAVEPQSIDIINDPLVTVRLIKLGREAHALLVHMEHIISDGQSMSIFHEELFASYRLASQGKQFSFDELPLQFADYAARQRSSRLLTSTLGARLNESFSGYGRVVFPAMGKTGEDSGSGMKVVKFSINRELRAELLDWCRSRQTTLVMGAFTAYTALALRWCDTKEMVVLFQTDGRSFTGVGASIGYYAFPIYLRVRVCEQDTFADLMARLKAEYCEAYEKACYSYLEAQVPRPEFTRNCSFNWFPQSPESEHCVIAGDKQSVSFQRVELEQTTLKGIMRDTEPMFGLLETSEDLIGTMVFSTKQVSTESMEAFSANYLSFIRVMMRRHAIRVKDVSLI